MADNQDGKRYTVTLKNTTECDISFADSNDSSKTFSSSDKVKVMLSPHKGYVFDGLCIIKTDVDENGDSILDTHDFVEKYGTDKLVYELPAPKENETIIPSADSIKNAKNAKKKAKSAKSMIATQAAGDQHTMGSVSGGAGINVVADGSSTISRVFKEGLLTVDGNYAYCVDINAHFRTGIAIEQDALTYGISQLYLDRLATVDSCVDTYGTQAGLNAEQKYMMKQLCIWRLLDGYYGWKKGNTHLSSAYIATNIQGNILDHFFNDPTDPAYIGRGTVYVNGANQPLAIFWREKKTTYTNLSVQKIWDDYDNAAGMRPGEVTVDLYWYYEGNPDTKYLWDTKTLNAANGWYIRWDNLIRQDGGGTYGYDIQERSVNGYYQKSLTWTGDYASGWKANITNSIETLNTELSVHKNWDDNNNLLHSRPEQIKVNLIQWDASDKEGTKKVIDTAVLNESNNWQATWKDLVLKKNKVVYEYDAEEQPVENYKQTDFTWSGDYFADGGWKGEITNTIQTGKAKIKKISDDADITNGNRLYSLKGAVYAAYSDEKCKDKLTEFTTDESGESNEAELSAGTYYIKEISAPAGMALSDTVYKATVQAGQETVVNVSDPPKSDIIKLLLQKVDSETGKNKGQGLATLKGAQYTVKYYDVYSDKDPGASNKALRTWVFETDENGEIKYDDTHKISGDALYQRNDGTKCLPLGTITIQETKAPDGYELNDQIYVSQIKGIAAEGDQNVKTYNPVTWKERLIYLTITKKETGTDRAIPNVIFEHTRPDGKTEELNTGEDGSVKIMNQVVGQHTIKEVKTVDGYSIAEGEVTFTIDENKTLNVISNTTNGELNLTQDENSKQLVMEASNDLAPYTAFIVKTNEKGKALPGAEFTLYSDKECTKEVGKEVTSEEGTLSFSNLEVNKKYYVTETKAPAGYRIPVTQDNKPIIYELQTTSNPLEQEFHFYIDGNEQPESSISGTVADREVTMTIKNDTLQKLPETGTHVAIIITILAVICLGVGIFAVKKKRK